MSDVFMAFFLYKFLMELLLCTGFFVFPLPRRKHFTVRMLCGIACCVLCSTFWNEQMSQDIILCIMRYLLLFSGVTLAVWFAFDVSFLTVLFCTIGGYGTQHLLYKMIWLIDFLLGSQVEMNIDLVYFLIMFFGFLMIWFLFTRQLWKGNYKSMENPKNLLLCSGILLCTVVFSAVFSKFETDMNRPIVIICCLYDIICCLFALNLQLGMFENDQLKQEITVIQQLHQKELEQLAISRETVNLVNIKCHDMKHQISRLLTSDGRTWDKELNQLENLIRIYDCSVDTGNSILNLILAEKSIYCQNANIQLNCMADGAKLAFLEEGDLYSLFGNIIDNAIHAAQQLPDQQQRVITLTVREMVGMLSISSENFYQGELDFEDGLPITQEEDKRFHGFGMKSIRYLVEKYEGELLISAEDGIFSLNIIFPITL